MCSGCLSVSLSVGPALMNATFLERLGVLLQIWHKCFPGFKAQLSRFWWLKVKVTLTLDTLTLHVGEKYKVMAVNIQKVHWST